MTGALRPWILMLLSALALAGCGERREARDVYNAGVAALDPAAAEPQIDDLRLR